MNNRRDFLKKAAMLAGGLSMTEFLNSSIAKAMEINPQVGSSYLDAEHVVILMQENRSFDHAFGTLQGVRGFNDPRTIVQPNGRKVWLQTNDQGQTYTPFRLDIKNSKVTWMGCLPHNWTDQTDARNQGKMNRWLDVKASGFKEFKNMPLTMGYYSREDIPFYYSLADAFTICDHNFCSSLTGTNPNRLYFWTGNIRENLTGNALVWNGDSEFSGKANWKTFPERLSEANIDWKFYQNEISTSSAGYSGKANSWLGNFGCNVLEYFPQYEVKYSKRYRDLLVERIAVVQQNMEELSKENKNNEELKKLEGQLQVLLEEKLQYTAENFEKLSPFTKEIHQRAFVNNSKDPQYMELEELVYEVDGKQQILDIPKGDILYQFREDVSEGKLPTVSWLAAPQLFSDHPDSPWFGAWYVSEVMNILTKNPEVWKKTIFILTYDENDGYFDHVAPYAATNPYQAHAGKVSEGIHTELEYVRKEEQYWPESGRESNIGLGYRVPMIIASPWSRGGWVNSQVFDHSSSLQFLESFLNKKLSKNIRESNISTWRRTICGDLTSAFRPYRGEEIIKPTFLEKEPFYKSINNAKFKDLPQGFKNLTTQEIEKIQLDPTQSTLFPKQEKGIRNACPLPYDLLANGSFDPLNKVFNITLAVSNPLNYLNAVGAPFTVYSHGKTPENWKTWDYTVAPEKTLSDQLMLENLNQQNHHISIHGPNGFYRNYKGSNKNPTLISELVYEKSKNGKLNTGKLILKLTNYGDHSLEVLIQEDVYRHQEQKLKIAAGKAVSKLLDFNKSFHWYDFKLTCKEFEDYKIHFAGHVETIHVSKTDPYMGGLYS